jgi:hypothetical protein
MPQVRILAGTAGTDLVPGEVRTLPGPEAAQLVAEGRAELIREVPTELADVRRTRSRTRTASYGESDG